MLSIVVVVGASLKTTTTINDVYTISHYLFARQENIRYRFEAVGTIDKGQSTGVPCHFFVFINQKFDNISIDLNFTLHNSPQGSVGLFAFLTRDLMVHESQITFHLNDSSVNSVALISNLQQNYSLTVYDSRFATYRNNSTVMSFTWLGPYYTNVKIQNALVVADFPVSTSFTGVVERTAKMTVYGLNLSLNTDNVEKFRGIADIIAGDITIQNLRLDGTAGGKDVIGLIHTLQNGNTTMVGSTINFNITSELDASCMFYKTVAEDNGNWQVNITDVSVTTQLYSGAVPSIVIHDQTTAMYLIRFQVQKSSQIYAKDQNYGGLIFQSSAKLTITHIKAVISFYSDNLLNTVGVVVYQSLPGHSAVVQKKATYDILPSGVYSHCPCYDGDCANNNLRVLCDDSIYTFANKKNGPGNQNQKHTIINNASYAAVIQYSLNLANPSIVYDVNNSILKYEFNSEHKYSNSLFSALQPNRPLYYRITIMGNGYYFTGAQPPSIYGLVSYNSVPIKVYFCVVNATLAAGIGADYGGMVGYVDNDCIIYGCVLNGTLYQQNPAAKHVLGGMVALASRGSLTIENCTVASTNLSSKDTIGGLIGVVRAAAVVTVKNCTIGGVFTHIMDAGTPTTLPVYNNNSGAAIGIIENGAVVSISNTTTVARGGYDNCRCGQDPGNQCQSIVCSRPLIVLESASFTHSKNYTVTGETKTFIHAIPQDVNVNNTILQYKDSIQLTNIGTSFSALYDQPLYYNILLTSVGVIQEDDGRKYAFSGSLGPFMTTQTYFIDIEDNVYFNFTGTYMCGMVAAVQADPIIFINCNITGTKHGNEMGALLHQISNNSVVSIRRCSMLGTIISNHHSTFMVRMHNNVTLSITDFAFTGELNSTGNSGHVAIIGYMDGNGVISFDRFILNGIMEHRPGGSASGITDQVRSNSQITLSNGEISCQIVSRSGAAAGVAAVLQASSNATISNITVNLTASSESQRAAGLFADVGNSASVQLTDTTVRGSYTSGSAAAAGVAANVQESVTVRMQNVTVSATVRSDSGTVGGVIAAAGRGLNLTIDGGSLAVNVSTGSGQYAGGVVGDNSANTGQGRSVTLSNLDLDVTVAGGNNSTGGIVSDTWTCQLLLQSVRGSITVNGGAGNVGGVCGLFRINGWVNVTGSDLQVTVAGSGNSTGGLVGDVYNNNHVVIRDTALRSTVRGTGANVGGVVGHTNGNPATYVVENSTLEAEVQGGGTQAGVIGQTSGQPTLQMSNTVLRFTGLGTQSFGAGAVVGWMTTSPTQSVTNVTVHVDGIYGGCPGGAASPAALGKATAEGGSGFYCMPPELKNVTITSFTQSTSVNQGSAFNTLSQETADYNYTRITVSGDIAIGGSWVKFGELSPDLTVFQDVVYSGSRTISSGKRGGGLLSQITTTTYIFNVTVSTSITHTSTDQDFGYGALFERNSNGASVYVGNYSCDMTFNSQKNVNIGVSGCSQDLFAVLYAYNFRLNPTMTFGNSAEKAYPLVVHRANNGGTCTYHNVVIGSAFGNKEISRNGAGTFTCTGSTALP